MATVGSTPNPIVIDLGDQVKTIMTEFIEIRGIQSAFNAFLVHEEKQNIDTYNSIKMRLQKLFEENRGKETESGLKQIVHIAANHGSAETVDLIMKILHSLVVNSSVPARMTCEALLENEKLVYKHTKFWISSFNLIQSVIELVDYKGVREIMKTCLEKIAHFPADVPHAHVAQLQCVVKLMTTIFDRNACLLPAYFIVNEILKSFPENRNFPHWSISRLLGGLVDSFKPIAQMVSVIGRSKLMPIVEHSGNAGFLIHSWKLDPTTLRFILKGNLPYDKELLQPQDKLMRYILEQPYSRDMACAILGLQKQQKTRCKTLEDRLVELIVIAMEKTENEMEAGQDDISGATSWLWQHLSTQLIFFVLFQFCSFPHIVNGVYDKLLEAKLFRGRDFLMWILLQFISGSIQKNPLSDFLPVLRLYDLLYPEQEPLSVPDVSKSQCTSQMAAACIWIHIFRKAQTESNLTLPRPLPSTLKKHFEYLQSLVQPSATQLPLTMNDFKVALLCNAFSTNQELFSRPMGALVEVLHGSTTAAGATTQPLPLSVQILDSLTVHTKMSLIHSIVTNILKTAQPKNNQTLAPAFVETYARLLVYMEIESLGIKGFISQLLPNVYKAQAWGILHTLLEMFCYRLHHIQPHYRVQLLSHLHNLAANAQTNLSQLHLCVEMTALRLITGFNSVDVHSQLSRYMADPKQLVSAESEELNRALILTIARAIHVTGCDGTIVASAWFREVIGCIMQNTPHSWSTHTLQCFPPILAEYFQQNQVPKENKQQLKNMVEEEFRNWNSMSNNEVELIEHFSSSKSPPLFLCIVWKMIVETDRMNPVVFKILERIGPKGLSAHLRKFCDYVVSEFANAGGGLLVTKLTDSILNLVWKYNIVPFDRLLLCMALRTQEGNEAQVCFFIIHLLTVKPAEFRNRIQEFVREASPDHWKQSDWHEKHKAFHTKYPETFHYEDQSQTQLPVYFGNVCLRFLPVFDIVIHRYLEINLVGKNLEMMLEHMGPLYKFHDRPITYLYNTLHYYESRLRDKAPLKRRLVSSIIGSLQDVKPPNWALTDQFRTYLQTTPDETSNGWIPDTSYYAFIVNRFVEVVEGKKKVFTGVDWRYNEFPNPAAHVLHATCVELMALPIIPSAVCEALVDVTRNGKLHMQRLESPSTDLECWFNGCALILVTLPDPYWLSLHDIVLSTIDRMSTWSHRHSPLTLFNYNYVVSNCLYNEYAFLLGILHAMWHHLGTGHIHHIHTLMVEKLPAIVKTETQLLFVCYMVGPFLQRFNGEKPPMVCRITVALYDLLELVDRSSPPDAPLAYIDTICDLLYHIKYMYTGDMVKAEVEAKIRNLRPALKMRLRFITPPKNFEEIAAAHMPQTGGVSQSQ